MASNLLRFYIVILRVFTYETYPNSAKHVVHNGNYPILVTFDVENQPAPADRRHARHLALGIMRRRPPRIGDLVLPAFQPLCNITMTTRKPIDNIYVNDIHSINANTPYSHG